VDALWTLWTDPAVRRYLFDDVEITREEAAATLADARAAEDRGLGLWTVHARDEGATLVGCAGLLPVGTAAAFAPRLAGMVEPLVALLPACWGRGYATEALGALVGHAFDVLGLRELAGVTDVPNAASDRMLRRAGFVPAGECDGPRYPMRIYLRRPAEPR
jgi:RimJ/RimL family protein N-acetyltransferase